MATIGSWCLGSMVSLNLILIPNRIPDAEDAKVTQKEYQKEKIPKIAFLNSPFVFVFFFGVFCVFCVTFASSASGIGFVFFYAINKKAAKKQLLAAL
jgi:hypothetical protein